MNTVVLQTLIHVFDDDGYYIVFKSRVTLDNNLKNYPFENKLGKHKCS